MNKVVWSAGVAVLALAATVIVSLQRDDARRVKDGASVSQAEVGSPAKPARPVGAVRARAERSVAQASVADDVKRVPAGKEDPQTEEEDSAAAEEAKVEAFDALTDKWMEPSKREVSMADANAFVKTFRQVPHARRDECIHRALNLIPDENVMLLAAILMDKTMDKAVVETVFNDILNRDEDVKQPIMKEIFKDKTHPCWADVAWILDVTGAKKE